jgi:hypothetical protein
MVINKNLDSVRGVKMIEQMLNQYKDKLPEGKTIRDFGGGYVECLKTKAKVVLYFGFDGKKNRVSINFQIKKEEILLWLEAIAEKIWNIEDHDNNVVSFDSLNGAEVVTSKKNGETIEDKVNKDGIKKPAVF